MLHWPLRIKNILTRRRGCRRDAGGGAVQPPLQPVSLSYLPTLGGSGQSAATGTCGPILAGGGVKTGPDSTKSNLLGKFAFDSLLTGCTAFCSREMGALGDAVMGVGDQCGICSALLFSLGWEWGCFRPGAQLLSLWECIQNGNSVTCRPTLTLACPPGSLGSWVGERSLGCQALLKEVRVPVHPLPG